MKNQIFKRETNWCVITGAPSSGKTSVIEELAQRGYAIQNEIARELIEECLRRGMTLAEVRGPDHVKELQKRILQLKAGREKALDPEKLIFSDRGTPDSISYFRLAGLETEEAVAASKIFRYRAVFMLDRLPLKSDGVRTEDDAQAEALGRMIAEDYKALGYALTPVPVMPVPARVDFILDALGAPKTAKNGG